MAQTSFFSWDTNGVGDGTATGYTEAQVAKTLRMLLTSAIANSGVPSGYLNSLAVSNPAGSTIRVATGGGLVHGVPYENDASIDFTPGDGTYPALPVTAQIHRVVLRKSWAAQTVRLAFISGTDAGSPSTPSLTQTDLATWEIPIYQFQINSAGAISGAVDQRVFIGALQWRQGDGSADWDQGGTSNMRPGTWKVQAGVVVVGGTSTSVTFPVAFSDSPIVLTQPARSTSGLSPAYGNQWVADVTASGFTVFVDTTTNLTYINWIAIGSV